MTMVTRVDIRRAVLLLSSALLAISLGLVRFQDRQQLTPYTEFLKQQKSSVKEYILNLFENHDIVVLCERLHPEITQYELFLSIIEDKRFTNEVGNIFTEVGVSNLRPEVDKLLHSESLAEDSAQKIIMHLQRNCSFYPLWDNYNFSYFLAGLYRLNRRLPVESKVNLYPSDIPFDWQTADTASLRKFWSNVGIRDSVIAAQVIDTFEQILNASGKRKKSLMIMNYRHAFGHKFEHPLGVKPSNVGRFLFDRYGERVANVYLNSQAIAAARSDNDISFSAIQDGKWDAAFEITGIRDLGFDFQGSPFGRDQFDIWPFNHDRFRFADVFTGFAFYMPLSEQRTAIGVPGIIDSAFGQELMRRNSLFEASLPNRTWRDPRDIDSLKIKYNIKQEHRLEVQDTVKHQIQKWQK
jgi:hypothetical protein